MMSRLLPILLLSLILFPGAYADSPRVYISPMESSTWVLGIDSVLRCEIEHRIPGFGKAIFYQEAGRDLKLALLSKRRFRKDMDVSLRLVAAGWKRDQEQTELTRLKSSGGGQLIEVGGEYAQQAYAELESGYQPGAFFYNSVDRSKPVLVVISTVNFRAIQSDFEACQERLYPDHFDDVRSARIHFDFDQEFPIEKEEDSVLQRMLDYVQVDDAIRYLVVSGHTDRKGSECYNDSLSARRAWYVYDLLVQSGVAPSRLRVEFHGEHRPLKTGRSDSDHAANRRVSVTLHK